MAEGQTLMDGGRAREALDAFMRAQRARPDRREPYMLIAGLCESAGMPDVGIPVLRQAVERGDENQAAYSFMLAVLLERADDREGAEGAYRDAIRLDPTFAPAYGNLGQFLFTGGRNREALEIMHQASERFPGYALLGLQYAELLLRDGRLDAAEPVARAIVESRNPPPQSHYLMGLIHLQRGENGAARTRLETATRLDPEDARAWYQLANACDRLGDPGGSARALTEFEALYRRDLGERAVR
jgi:Flp pilus assembly protein TadD